MHDAGHPAFDRFVGTVARLRSPEDGCPWNRAQTHASIGDYLIEEAYEALDAIQAGDDAHLREELGDVLLQVVLHTQIAADEGAFTIDDVCEAIDEKMVRRHPHVFGDAVARDSNEVSELWEQVKLAEKARVRDGSASDEAPHLLDDVPTHFPALLQAQKISRRAVAAGFEWETIDDVWDKVAEERAELLEAYAAAPKSADGKLLREGAAEAQAQKADSPAGGSLAGGSPAEGSPGASAQHAADAASAAELEFGDLLFALVNVARKMGIDAEGALRASNAKFRRRFASMEDAARAAGRSIEDLSTDEMEALWQRVKEAE